MKPSPAKKREVFMTVKWVEVVVGAAVPTPLQKNSESSMEETFILVGFWRCREMGRVCSVYKEDRKGVSGGE